MMRYEVVVDGRRVGEFWRVRDAMAFVHNIVCKDCNCEPELFDLQTHRPVMLAGSVAGRELLSMEVGF
jgi:hypothetical protein